MIRGWKRGAGWDAVDLKDSCVDSYHLVLNFSLLGCLVALAHVAVLRAVGVEKCDEIDRREREERFGGEGVKGEEAVVRGTGGR